MLGGDLEVDTPTLLRQVLAWTEKVANDMHTYLVDPRRHPGGTNDTALELSAARREVVETTLKISAHHAAAASAHLRKGEVELAVHWVIRSLWCVGDGLNVLLGVSAYETGRVDNEARAEVTSDEAEKRSTNARKGARKPTFTDGALTEYINEWQARNGKKRGSIKAAAAHFDVTDAAIGKRRRKIGTG